MLAIQSEIYDTDLKQAKGYATSNPGCWFSDGRPRAAPAGWAARWAACAIGVGGLAGALVRAL
jgi:hypothetical protein